MVNLTSNEEKVRKILMKYPNGVKARTLVAECYISRSPLYVALNRLKSKRLAFQGAHALWYPHDPMQEGHEKPESQIITDLKQIKEDYVKGFIDKAFKRFTLLLESENCSKKDWIEKNKQAFSELIELSKVLDKKRQIINADPLNQGNFELQKSISEHEKKLRQIKERIIVEGLKYWAQEK